MYSRSKIQTVNHPIEHIQCMTNTTCMCTLRMCACVYGGLGQLIPKLNTGQSAGKKPVQHQDDSSETESHKRTRIQCRFETPCTQNRDLILTSQLDGVNGGSRFQQSSPAQLSRTEEERERCNFHMPESRVKQHAIGI